MKISKKRINDLVIVVIDGKIYNRTNVTDEIWLQILEKAEELEQSMCSFKDYITKEPNILLEEFFDLIIPERIAKRLEEAKAKEKVIEDAQLELDFETRIRKAKRIVDISGLFEYDEDGITYLKGFKYPMPKILVEALLDAHYNPNSEYTVNSLINFWKYLLLNPDKHVRTGLFQWIKTGKFAITEDGNIIAYRNVDVKKKSTNKELQDFISESWAKVKKWKKSPKNYEIWRKDIDSSDEKGEYILSLPNKVENNTHIFMGALDTLYTNLSTSKDVTIYTDNYTHKMEIKLGKEVTMPRNECDNDPNSSCSRGLHNKSASYNLNCGEEVLVTLVNPYKVVAIPSRDTSKFRSCGYLPISKAELNNGKLVEFEAGSYDIPYNGLEELVDLLKTESLEELQSKGEISNEITIEDFDFVMSKAKEVISTRIIKL